VIWACWHLPQFFVPEADTFRQPHHGLPVDCSSVLPGPDAEGGISVAEYQCLSAGARQTFSELLLGVLGRRDHTGLCFCLELVWLARM